MKDKFLVVRVSAKEKKEVQKDAKKAGYDNVSVFILWLYREYKKYKKLSTT